MDNDTSFGSWVRRRRKALDLTQEALTQRVGCALDTLRKIESGARRPSHKVAERLAIALDVPRDTWAAFLHAARADLTADDLSVSSAPTPPSPPLTPRHPAHVSPPPALPSGTVTFLCTDIEGSTQLWDHQPDAMRAALARHDTILRRTITAHGGTVFKSGGDGVYAAFPRAPDALIAAVVAQQALLAEPWRLTGPLRVRMVLHTGVSEERDGDYFGPPLNRTVRLLAVAHGGQILLSRATQELVCDTLPSELSLCDLGTHRLRDLTRPEHIFQVLAPHLPTDFPPLRTLDTHPHNLPAQLTPLIGRTEEIAVVSKRLRHPDVRLVTLTGSGGTGKTRLALQVAAELLDNFADGVYFVDLAPLSDPTLVATVIAQTLGVTGRGGRALIEDLKTFLRDKQILLVLDNFEQVLDAASLVAELLAAAPHVKVLSTSREILHLRGEKEVPVPPLAFPDPKQLPSSENLSQYTAVELFIQRAVDVKPDFAVTSAHVPTLVEICHRLDGLPLAIELAAARIKLFPLEMLLKRLEHRLPLLTSGPRDVPARQQTLRNTLDWSYHLLDEGEQRLFRRMAVFVSGCTLEAVEAVCIAADDPPMEGINGPTALIDKSLLRQIEGTDGELRFIMLETIREYALELLAASGEEDTIRQRHAAHYLALVAATEPRLRDANQAMWLDRLEQEHDNLRAALAWALGGGNVGVGAQLAGALGGFWIARGYELEGRAWLEQVLRQRRNITPAIPAMVLLRASWFVMGRSDFVQATTLCEEALTLFRELGNTAGSAQTLVHLGSIAWLQSDYPCATRILEESMTLYQELGDKPGIASALRKLGDVAREQGDSARAMALYQEALILFRETGNREGTARALNSVGDLAYSQGDYVRATELYQQALALFGEVGHKRGRAWTLRNLGRVAHAQGDDTQALALLEETVALFQEGRTEVDLAETLHHLGVVAHARGDDARALALLRESLALRTKQGRKWQIAESLECYAELAAGQGQAVQAARSLGAAVALRAAIGAPLPPGKRSAYDRTIASIHAQLDEASFLGAWEAGHALSLEQAIAEALGEPAKRPEM